MVTAMSIPAWDGDWRADIAQAVATLGFMTLKDYAAQRPAMTYEELASELGKVAERKLAPIQIEQLLRDNAKSRQEVEQFVRSSLVRHLRCLMADGWGNGEDSKFNFAHAIGAWTSRLPKSYGKRCERLGMYLLRLKPHQGWLPETLDDQSLAQAFHTTRFRFSPLQSSKK
jgi:hypothetical protein